MWPLWLEDLFKIDGDLRALRSASPLPWDPWPHLDGDLLFICMELTPVPCQPKSPHEVEKWEEGPAH